MSESTTDYSGHDVGYAYHSKGPMSNREFTDWLQENRRVAVHYQNAASVDPSHYSGSGKAAIRRINRYAQGDALLVAFYPHIDGKAYVGEVKDELPRILVIDDGEVIDTVEIGFEEHLSEDEFEYDLDQYCIAKSIQVREWKVAPHEEYMPLWDGTSQGSLHDSHEKKEYVRELMAGNPFAYTLASLDGNQKELLAEKWLRNHYEDFQLDAPRGGKLQNVDIIGSTQEKTLFAQVTGGVAERARERGQKLADYTGEHSDTYLFAPEDSHPRLPNGVKFVELESILADLEESARGRKSLDVMLGRWAPE